MFAVGGDDRLAGVADNTVTVLPDRDIGAVTIGV
jgi:hypothetical protein